MDIDVVMEDGNIDEQMSINNQVSRIIWFYHNVIYCRSDFILIIAVLIS